MGREFTMLFNSHLYIFVFLPLTAFVYFSLNRMNLPPWRQVILSAASLAFYGWVHPAYVALLLGSISFNYLLASFIIRQRERGAPSFKSFFLTLGISVDILLLCYFKYADFFISNANMVGGLQIPLLHVILPAGVSFFTLNQIGYLLDSFRGKIGAHHFLSHLQFVSFFPYILAGPVVRYEEVVPQLTNPKNGSFDYANAGQGVFLFFIGLFKKVVFADTLAVWANNGFDNGAALNLVEAWVTSLSYTLQLYFDFSGYTDMALGSALIFNIKLPVNFDSPYKSLNIQEFWHRWHITLGRFMRDYVYIPLGGSRVHEIRVLANFMITFIIIGVWHGAGWTFVVWGCMHGGAMIAHRIWKRFNVTMPKPLAWFLTFNFVNGCWVLFRAKDLEEAGKVLKGMAGLNGLVLPKFAQGLAKIFSVPNVSFANPLSNINGNDMTFLTVFGLLFMSVTLRNSTQMAQGFKPSLLRLSFLAAAATLSILFLGRHSEFLYFRF